MESLGAAVDSGITHMSALIVKCQQLSDSMPPVESLMVQMCGSGGERGWLLVGMIITLWLGGSKRAKRTLDLLEQALESRAGLAHYPV